MSDWVILSKPSCPSCVKAKRLLDLRGLSFDVVEHSTDEQIESFKAAGHRTFPRVYHEGTLVGGAEALESYLRELEEADF